MVEQAVSDVLSEALTNLPQAAASLLPALHHAHRIDGFISDQAIETIATHTRLTRNEIEGVVSGFPDFQRTPPRPHRIRICDGLSCRCNGLPSSFPALVTAESDDRIAIEHSPCLFACTVGPAIEIDGRIHGRLTAESADALIQHHLGAWHER